MKLITKETYYLLIVYLSIFVLVGVSYYFLTTSIISDEFNKSLYHRKYLAIKQLTKSDSLIRYQQFSDHLVSVKKLQENYPPYEKFGDTSIFDKDENNYLRYRQLAFTVTINKQPYLIHVRRLAIENDSLAGPLLLLTIVLFIILLISLNLVNRRVSGIVWKPFYQTLNVLRSYQLKQETSIAFQQTDIDEFSELNAVLSQLTERLKKDFHLLKEFTENTSHELQTPLAVIKSKLELLLQSEDLSDTQYKYINVCYASVNKLSRLSEGLGLLSKIENSQFVQTEKVNILQLIKNKIQNYEDLMAIKGISMRYVVHEEPWKTMNPILADILIENLVNNAIKHNVQDGSILVETFRNKIIFSNTGNSLNIEPATLFERFSKVNSQSFGLGLSIVKQICTQNDFTIEYRNINDKHVISIQF